MDMAAHYREHALHPALRGVVEAAWSVGLPSDAAPTEHRVLPDGCIDIVVAPGADPVIVGPTSRPSLNAMRPGETVHGLRFRPGAAPFLLRASGEELRDRVVPLAELLPGDPRDLQALVASHLSDTDPLVDAAVAQLAHGADVRGLARELAISERQLRRRFHQAVGYGPKRLARILRLQRLLAEARRRPTATGAQLAAAAGYADEPHMGRDARALAGTAPRQLLEERGRSVLGNARG